MADHEETRPLLLSQNMPTYSNEHSMNDSTDRELEKKQRKQSLMVIYLTAFIGSVSFSICISSIWPYLLMLDPKATTTYLGWVVGSYSIGQCVASLIVGWLAKKMNKALYPMLICLLINVAGSVFYCYLIDLPTASIRSTSLLISRTMIGCGAGIVAITRSYISQATTLEERTSAMTYMNAAQALGFILGPAFQAMFAFLGYPGPLESDYFHFDIYTAPGFLGVILGIVNILLILVYFKEFKVENEVGNSPAFSVNSDLSSSQSITPLPPLDKLVTFSLLFIFFVALTVFSLMETLLTPMMMDEYAYTKHKATVTVGIMLAIAGVLSIVALVLMKTIARKVDERIIYFGGFAMCAIAYVLWLPWGNTYPVIKPNVTIEETFDFEFYWDEVKNSSDVPYEPTGCDTTQKTWCTTVPQINYYLFMIGFTLSTIGYPISNVLSNTFFSKVLGPINQGLWMGILSSAGSMARFIGPLLVGFLYGEYGPRAVAITMISVLSFTAVYIVIIYRRLIPRVKRQMFQSNNISSTGA